MRGNFLLSPVKQKLANILKRRMCEWAVQIIISQQYLFAYLLLLFTETNMRRLMSLHFSLVVCYYDNKDPFDARRPFYLQISLLNVITMHVHKQACVRVCVCVCFTLKKAYSCLVISPTMKNLCALCSLILLHHYLFCVYFNCYFSLTYA